MQQITLAGINIRVAQKNIKNVHLSVYPPSGSVRISAPSHMNIETIRAFAITKLSWIRQQQAKLSAQEREAPRDYITRESHYYLGKRYLLKITEHDAAPRIVLRHNDIEMLIRPDVTVDKRMDLLNAW